MFSSLIAGILLGLSAGFSPGPLITFVITQTLQHGIKEGLRVALAPLITDLPIILVSVFVLAQLANVNAILGGVSLLGACFVGYLAYESFRTNHLDVQASNTTAQSLRKGVLVNLLSPHPYLFWFMVGAPMIVKAWQENALAALAFVVGFYVCLVGSKLLVAVLVGKSRQFFVGRSYAYLMRVLGVLLLVFALLLARDGLDLLGLFK